MSLQDAINTGNSSALDWTNIRFKSLNLDGNLESTGDIISSGDLSVNDGDFSGNVQIDGNLNVDGTLTAGAIIPAGIVPGAPNTFLHTNNLSNVVWQPFSAGNITGGNDYDILTKDPILGWQATQQLQNQNLPDPIQVNTIDVDNITDVTASNGLAGQVLAKSGLNNLEWSNFIASNITGGVDGDLLKNVGGTWTYVPAITNSNLPDPLSVNDITGVVSVSSANVIPDDITDTSASVGTAGQFLQKSNPGNLLVWGAGPSSSPNNIAVHTPSAYFLPTALSNINLSAVFGTSQQYTLAGGVISLNNVATEKVNINLFASVRVSLSDTSFNIYILLNGVNMFSYRTQKIQAADTNHYTSININTNLDVPAGGQLTIQSQRAVGTGTMQVDPAAFNPYYAFMFSVNQIS